MKVSEMTADQKKSYDAYWERITRPLMTTGKSIKKMTREMRQQRNGGIMRGDGQAKK